MSANQADDIICNLPNVLFTTAGLRLARNTIIAPAKAIPKINPPIGAIMIQARTLVSPPKTSCSKHSPAIPAHIIPPINEWLLEIGSPKYVHNELQAIAPAKPPIII